MKCPNINSNGWKYMVDRLGEDLAYLHYFKNDDLLTKEEVDNIVNKNKKFIIPLNESKKEILLNKINNFEISFFTNSEAEDLYNLLNVETKQELSQEGVENFLLFKDVLNNKSKKTGLLERILVYIKRIFIQDSVAKILNKIKNNNSSVYTIEHREFLNSLNKGKISSYNLINILLYKAITPLSYDKEFILKNMINRFFLGSSFETQMRHLKELAEKNTLSDKALSIISELDEESFNKREDAWRLSNGLSQKHNSFKYLGKGSIHKGQITYSFEGEDIYELRNPKFLNDEKSVLKGIDNYNLVMGKYYTFEKEDEYGHYIEYSDRWDLEVRGILQKVIDYTQTPFILTGKIYKAIEYDEFGEFVSYLTYDRNDVGVKLLKDITKEEDLKTFDFYEEEKTNSIPPTITVDNILPKIKEGVPELFESNLELANAVYEAAGIRNPNVTVLPNGNLKIVAFRTEKVGPASKGQYQRGKGLYLSLDKPYPGEDVYTVEIEISPKNLLDRKLGFGEISEDYFIDEKNKRVDKQLDTLHEFKQSLGIKAEIGSIDGALMNELVLFDKELINKALASKQAYNPQQKQQAQQLYSQYLDTIFPDSKVKEIVYHGTNVKFDKFDLIFEGSNEKGGRGKGLNFTRDLEDTDLYGDIKMFVILNAQNRVTTDIEAKKDKLSYIDDVDEIVVYNSEQIHILGSKQDIEGFKKFVNKEQQSDLNTIPSNITIEQYREMFPEDYSTDEQIDKIISAINAGELTIECRL